MAAPIDLSGSNSLEEQIYTCALRLQNLELGVPEEDRPDNTSVSFDTESGNVTLEVTLDTVTTIVNGTAVIAATPYLA